MPDTTVKKAEGDFMNITEMSKFKYLVSGCIFIIALGACKDQNNNFLMDELPFPQPFSKSVNLILPAYQKIEFENHLYFNDIGLNGVVVVRLGEGLYAAYERTCPVDPDSDCAIITHTNSGAGSSYLSCGCGEAVYRDYSGEPSKSPEPRKKLREYLTFLSGTTLTIDSDIIQ